MFPSIFLYLKLCNDVYLKICAICVFLEKKDVQAEQAVVSFAAVVRVVT